MKLLLENHKSPARELIENVLRDGGSIVEEYPLVFRDESPGRLIAVGEGGDVQSACAILVRDFLVDGSVVRGGLIGSVTTHPACRDKGLATRVLIEAEAALQIEGCAFALLWAQDPEFYLRRGYGPMGAEQDFLVPVELARSLPEPVGVRPIESKDVAAVSAAYNRHTVRVERTEAETASLLECPGMSTLVLERDGDVVAYACLGRGVDLPDAIHEWSGEAEDVLALLRAHIERSPRAQRLFLMAPTSANELCYRLVGLGASATRGILGLGKVLDPEPLVALLDERLGDEGTASLARSDGGFGIRIQGPGGEGVLDADGALALTFATTEVRPEVKKLLDGFGLPGARLPLEPFAWGLDSI